MSRAVIEESSKVFKELSCVPEPVNSKNNKKKENKMADIDTSVMASQHGDIRREAAQYAADTRYNVAEQAHNLRASVGDIRQEQAENFGHTRRDLQAGFADTRYNLAERTGDIRREIAVGVDKTGDLVASTASDIRLEQQRQAFDISRQSGAETNEIVKEGLKGDFSTVNAIKDSRFEIVSRVENSADRLEKGITDTNFNLSNRVENAQDRNARDIGELRGSMADRFFGVGRDLSELKQGHATLSKDIELNSLKGQIEGQRNTQYLADRLAADGEKTRGLIQDLKYHDMNRGLVERNAALVNCEQDRHNYRDRWMDSRFDQNQAQFAGQWAQLQNQVQAFASQLQETRQGMVNFGTMAGVGQTSTSNNVR